MVDLQNCRSGRIDRPYELRLGSEGFSGSKELHLVQMSFETNEKTTTLVYFPYKVTITKIRGIVMKVIAGSDNGTIQAANVDGNMTAGLITCTASDALNTAYSVSPSANNVIQKNSYISLVSAKSTAGGKVLVSIELTRSE
jgi:hypothetical protein